MNELWIFGPVPPEPSGGVSTFVERLVRSGRVPVAGVIDPYAGRKNTIPATHITPAAPGTKERLRITAQLLRFRRSPLLINASRPRGAIALAPFLVARRAPTFLILHHGELRISGSFGPAALRLALSQYTRIGCLSEAQREFYLAHRVPPSRLRLIDPYFPPISESVDENAEPLATVLSWLREGEGPVVLSSGYAQEYYHHDWVLDAMEGGELPKGVRYLICCYGPATLLLKQLANRTIRIKNAEVAYGLGPNEFHYLLRRAHVYVRPTDIDSFGIAAWDAAAEGLKVVASNASRRPPHSFVHPVKDRGAFISCLRDALASREATVPPQLHQGAAESIANFLSQ